MDGTGMFARRRCGPSRRKDDPSATPFPGKREGRSSYEEDHTGTAGPDLRSLDEVLRLMLSAGNGKAVCVYHVLDAAGQRSFGPLLLVPSLIVVSPLSGIPGVPTLTGIIILLVAVQMLIGRNSIWLPEHVRRRCIPQQRLEQAVNFLSPAARAADKWVRPRLTLLTRWPFNRLIAAMCVWIAILMPPLELLPFATSVFAAAVAAFALALVAHDGMLAIAAFGIIGCGLALVLFALL